MSQEERFLSRPAYVVGIDLGTTNCVLAYAGCQTPETDPPESRIFSIPQLVGAGAVGERESLPSFLFLPGPMHVPGGALSLPWNPDASMAVGHFARDRGAEVPNRLISSAKSWLCHTGVDRNGKILPWEADEDSPRLSPVEASAALLRHLRDAWNHAMAQGNDHLRLENQEVVITVPASFDAVARTLTMQAADMAKLPQCTLIEEPQSAFYAWIGDSAGAWRKQVQVHDRILVVDIGGGTTDFSLIRVSEDQGDLVLERVAVGEHLLVGGDNMDLTLAYSVAGRLASEGRPLNAHQIRALCHSCRVAKEKLLGDQRLDSCPVTILGRGSKLIGGTIQKELTRTEVEGVLIDGFFPHCSLEDRPQEDRRAGMREMGLIYAADPAITRHIARFLGQAVNTEEERDAGPALPTAVLFNGGVMKAGPVRQRILDVLSSWARACGQAPPREIQGRDLDMAVAKGAAYYALVRRGKGIRIRGGLAKTYYLGVEAALPAVPGIPTPVKALCVAPFGMEEGTEATLPSRVFGLVVGQSVKFDFLASSVRRNDSAGTVVEDWAREIVPVTTLETLLSGEEGTVLPVTLEVKATEVGTLELWCVSREDGRRFRLEFNVREKGEE